MQPLQSPMSASPLYFSAPPLYLTLLDDKVVVVCIRYAKGHELDRAILACAPPTFHRGNFGQPQDFHNVNFCSGGVQKRGGFANLRSTNPCQLVPRLPPVPFLTQRLLPLSTRGELCTNPHTHSLPRDNVDTDTYIRTYMHADRETD